MIYRAMPPFKHYIWYCEEKAADMSNPPFADHLEQFVSDKLDDDDDDYHDVSNGIDCLDDEQLPMIDVGSLLSGEEKERKTCVEAIERASTEWGFFQVKNHGIGEELFGEMRKEQKKIFDCSFEKKSSGCGRFHKFYSWGAPNATSLHQFSWFETFHLPVSVISEERTGPSNQQQQQQQQEFKSLWEVLQRYTSAVSKLAGLLTGVLMEKAMCKSEFDGLMAAEKLRKETCFLRLNRYPPCPLSSEVHGITSHTDSDFLTILWQDEVGGLQLMKDSKWVSVNPNPGALIVNIGDLFQAWSNDVYRSVEHRVLKNSNLERFSVSYFLCPSSDSVVGSCREETSVYKKFTFGEYKTQVLEDVKRTGNKTGLSRFLL